MSRSTPDIIDVTPDPRPGVRTTPAGTVIHGVRCTAPDCRYPSPFVRERCPVCGARVEPDDFGPFGRIWSSTVVRVPTPGRTPPYVLAYVDLADGPRILSHVVGPTSSPQPGTDVRLTGRTSEGDLEVEVIDR